MTAKEVDGNSLGAPAKLTPNASSAAGAAEAVVAARRDQRSILITRKILGGGKLQAEILHLMPGEGTALLFVRRLGATQRDAAPGSVCRDRGRDGDVTRG